jgi:hypothetical protein
MAQDLISSLMGARIWLSGSVPDETSDADREAILEFVAGISRGVFRAGGSIIHGTHPTIWPTLLNTAAEFQAAGGSLDCLRLVVSRYYSGVAEESQMEHWRQHARVIEIPATDGDDKLERSLKLMRLWTAERCDALIVFGGKRWKQNPAGAGVIHEFELARQRGLPSFLLGGFGGAAGGYLSQYPEILRELKNGLDETTNREISSERNAIQLVEVVLSQLRRLPLVRGEALGGGNFRILALDGGGIKGTFTAAALAKWEDLLLSKEDKKTRLGLANYFDLVAGTSTGGILALGLGMGLKAADILAFYEHRGSVVFPLTSLRAKLLYGVRSILQPKFPQEVLGSQLEEAFSNAPGKHLCDSICRLVIPSCHARTGTVHLFRTNHHPDLVADAGLAAIDVALATAAAPTYFCAAEVDGRAYVDGGVWANNPVLAALVEAAAWLHAPINHIDILSIGTTTAPYSGRETLTSGMAGWLWKGRIVELLMHAQAQGAAELALRLAGSVRLLRVDQTVLPGEVSLDNVDRIRDLKDYGENVATLPEVLREIRERFINGVPVEPWHKE